MRAAPVSAGVLENDLLRRHGRLLMIFGLICQKGDERSKMHFVRALVFIAILWSHIVFAGLKLKGDLERSKPLDVLCCAIFGLCISAAVFSTNALVQRQRIALLLDYIAANSKSLIAPNNEIEHDFWLRTVHYVKLLLFLAVLPTSSTGILLFIDFAVKFMLSPEIFLDMEQITEVAINQVLLLRSFPVIDVCRNFFVGYSMPFVITLVGMFTVSIEGTLPAVLMKYVCYQYQVLGERLSTMDTSSLINSPSASAHGMEDEQHYRMKLCELGIREDCKIRWFMHELNKLIALPVFIDFVTYSAIFCFQFYFLLTSSLTYFLEVVFVLAFMIYTFLMLWYYHWHAMMILNSIENFRFAIYSSEWYNYPLRLQKTLLLIMMGTMEPIRLRSLFIELNVGTFVQILRGAYGYFNILYRTK